MSGKKPIFVTGIDTGIGKTLVAAILTEKLKADYWKPVQAGDLGACDTQKVKSLVSNTLSVFHPETYRLSQPFSPHKAAAIDKIKIDPEKFIMPVTDNQLIIEGAGGLMVPLCDDFLIIDLIKKLDAEVVLVSKNYLGSINHTLLSVLALKQYRIPVRGIVFNGQKDIYSKTFILEYSGYNELGHINNLDKIDRKAVTDSLNLITLS
jgi:dethiobiotin synthetase